MKWDFRQTYRVGLESYRFWATEMPGLIIAFGIALSLAAALHVYSIETASRRDIPAKKRRFNAFVYSLLLS